MNTVLTLKVAVAMAHQKQVPTALRDLHHTRAVSNIVVITILDRNNSKSFENAVLILSTPSILTK